MATPGAFTTDHVPVYLLYTEIVDSVERHNEAERSFLSLFCDVTPKRFYHVRARSMDFEESGQDTTKPQMQHVTRSAINLTEPTRYILGTAITREAYERGISSDEVREAHQEALDADHRLVTQTILRACLTDGGWYDATVTPPTYKLNTFSSTHDHYLAANVGGTPTFAHFSAAKTHILHHGYSRDIIVFMNNAQAAALEEASDFASNPTVSSTSMVDDLQKYGMTPQFQILGMPVVVDDWVPENYMFVVSLQLKPVVWRPTDNPETADLIVSTSTEESLGITYYFVEEYARWTSATVVRRGAGVAYYLGGSSWTDPTI